MQLPFDAATVANRCTLFVLTHTFILFYLFRYHFFYYLVP